jgi:Transposase IS66 family
VQILAGHGVHLDRSTLAGWVKRTAWWLKGLYELQLRTIHAAPLFFCDETPMPVLDPGRGRTKICQFWAHAVDDRPWGGPSPPAVAYVFADGRGKAEIAAQLIDYAGILQVDGYAAYKSLAKGAREAGTIRLAFCLAHARRKFVKIYKSTKSPFAQEVIERIAAIYAIEGRVRGRNADIRLAARKSESKPLMDELKSRLTEVLKDISAKLPLAEAIRYTLGHWDGLTVFLTDGRVEVDTNTVERSMRPIGLGRKNSLFKSWAILASVLNTATGSIRRPICATCSSASSRVAPRTISSTSCWHGTGRRPVRQLARSPHERAPPPLRASPMTKVAMPLDKLDVWLRGRTGAGATNLSMLDGFVTAIVAGPASMDPPERIRQIRTPPRSCGRSPTA